jgi:hypothetical protein
VVVTSRFCSPEGDWLPALPAFFPGDMPFACSESTTFTCSTEVSSPHGGILTDRPTEGFCNNAVAHFEVIWLRAVMTNLGPGISLIIGYNDYLHSGLGTSSFCHLPRSASFHADCQINYHPKRNRPDRSHNLHRTLGMWIASY